MDRVSTAPLVNVPTESALTDSWELGGIPIAKRSVSAVIRPG